MSINRESIREHWQFWTLTGLSGLTVVLVLVNIALFLSNRSIQTEVNARQQYVNQSMQLDRLNREMVTALANLAVRNNDEQLRTLLAEHGITFTVNPQGQAAAAPTKTQR